MAKGSKASKRKGGSGSGSSNNRSGVGGRGESETGRSSGDGSKKSKSSVVATAKNSTTPTSVGAATPSARSTQDQRVPVSSATSTSKKKNTHDKSSGSTASSTASPSMQFTAYTLQGRNSATTVHVPATIVNQRAEENSENRSSITTFNSVSALYEDEERDAKKELERRRQEIQTYVRHKLFPGWKFFTSEKQIAFNDNKGSIILKICNDLAVRKEHRHAWWDKNRKVVVQSLNQKRNDVTNYCKKIFIGTFKTTVSYLPSTIAVANTTVLLVYVYLHGEQVGDLLRFMCCDFL